MTNVDKQNTTSDRDALKTNFLKLVKFFASLLVVMCIHVFFFEPYFNPDPKATGSIIRLLHLFGQLANLSCLVLLVPFTWKDMTLISVSLSGQQRTRFQFTIVIIPILLSFSFRYDTFDLTAGSLVPCFLMGLASV